MVYRTVYITENLTVMYSPRKLKLHICKTELEDLSIYSRNQKKVHVPSLFYDRSTKRSVL